MYNNEDGQEEREPAATQKKKSAIICDQCGKSFSKKSRLDDHVLTHRDKKSKDFVCPLCDQRFSRQRTLNRHLQKKHQSKCILFKTAQNRNHNKINECNGYLA